MSFVSNKNVDGENTCSRCLWLIRCPAHSRNVSVSKVASGSENWVRAWSQEQDVGWGQTQRKVCNGVQGQMRNNLRQVLIQDNV